MKLFVEIFGWYGMAAIVSAYALSSFDALQNDGLLYQLLNLTGALGIIVVSLYKRTYQPGLLNVIWAIIALVGIIQIVTK